VPQQAFLWDHLKALDNVALVRRLALGEPTATAKANALKLLVKLEVDDVANRYPFRLSGGEQQRVSLARGLAAEADIYLLDEVTAHLDPRRRERIASLLRDLAAEGKTLIIATHDRRFAFQMSGQPFELTGSGLRPTDTKDTH
jgi:ABC-type polar amino acid transport system ATPase subunit